MRLESVMVTARSATFQAVDGGIVQTKERYRIRCNGEVVKEIDTAVFSLFDLKPGTAYEVVAENRNGERLDKVSFQTEMEFVTLDVTEFGAKGDGVQDDTQFIQTAILACPPRGRVLIPKGTYRIVSLFLKNDLNLELAKGAVLLGDTDPSRRPVLPGMIESYDEKEEYNLGSWEGNPLPMYAAILNGISVHNVTIYGEGCIDGGASYENWWYRPKDRRTVFRPRLVFLNRCSRIQMQGITCTNSPSWTIHPYFSQELLFCNLMIQNPKDSPNTDGLNPESCRDVRILGVHFDVGDDCIAVKSGKIYMGKKCKTPSEQILICQCWMENGHGAVTIGSEMAGGVKNVIVESCYFHNTDRGLRIKTRRGRGKDGVIDQIHFQSIRMEEVLTPIVVNCFYECDPDGRTTFVQSREVKPVDEGTPWIGSMLFRDMECKGVHYAAAYLEGLPEQKIEQVTLENINYQYAEQAGFGLPILSEGIKPCSKLGCYVKNVKKLIIMNVKVDGAVGEPFLFNEVDQIQQE